MARKDSIQINLEGPYSEAFKFEAARQFRSISDFGRLVLMDYIRKNKIVEKHEKYLRNQNQ